MPYTVDGQQVEILATLPGGKVVARRMYDDLGQPAAGPEFIRDAEGFYEAAPIPMISVEYQKLVEKCEELKAIIAENERKIESDRALIKAIDEMAPRNEALRRVVDCVKHGVKWIVTEYEGYVTLVDADGPDMEEVDDGWSHRLLSLFGDTNGDLSWKLNDKCSGWGKWEKAWPFVDYGEALIWAKTRVSQLLADENNPYLGYTLMSADRLHVDIPPEAMDRHKTASARRIRSKIEREEKILSDLRTELSKIQDVQGVNSEPKPHVEEPC